MSFDCSFFLNTTATPEDIRTLLVQTGLYKKEEDFNGLTRLSAPGVIMDIVFPPTYLGAPEAAGISATMDVDTSRTKPGLMHEWVTNTFRAVLTLLHAFPNDDVLFVYMSAPVLLRKDGRIILDNECEIWSPDVEPDLLSMLDLPYTFGAIPRD